MKKLIYSGFMALALVSAVGSASAAGNLVTNGGFEKGKTGWGFSGNVTVASGNVYASHGWTDSGYTNGNVALFGAGDKPGGGIYQFVPTVSGQSYKVFFDYGAITGAGRPQTIDVMLVTGSTRLGEQKFTAYGTSHLAQMMTTFEMEFTATSGFTAIEFFDVNIANGNGIDAVLDNVSITAFTATPAVPEPETYAMLLAGLGALGFVARRRKPR